MVKNLIKKITDRIDLLVLLKLATRKTNDITFHPMDVVNDVCGAAHTVVKSILFKYVLMTNIISGCIGFAIGMIVMWVMK